MTLHSIVIQKLLSTNAHIGRRVAAHHFKQFTYGTRNGMAIIDADKTLICLRNAVQFIATLAQQKSAKFMFINTNSLCDEIVEQMTKKIGCYSPSINTRGFLTNSHSPKTFKTSRKKVRFVPTNTPDCIVVFDSDRKSSVILEADKMQIPIVSIVDSAMPLDYYKKITYPIPANDSVQFVYLVCNLITKTFMLQQKNKKSIVDETAELLKEARRSKMKDRLLVVPYDRLEPISTDEVISEKILDKLAVLKYNGALATDLGVDGSKSTLEIRDGLTSIGLICKQIEFLQSKYWTKIPLFLMYSTKTHEDTIKAVEKYSSAKIDIRSIKETQHSQLKSDEGQSGENELYPTGHGAVLISLMKSGIVEVLLSKGKEYILVVNSDNVAATIDPNILTYLIDKKIEYCMEVIPTSSCASTLEFEATFKLAEIAPNFAKQSTDEFTLADTGSLWVNLRAVKRLMDIDAQAIEDISDSKGAKSGHVPLQEAAAGSARQLFKRAIGVNVPHSRVLSMNKTSDLLLLKSNLYTCHEGVLVQNKDRTNPEKPVIEFGPEFGKVSDLLSRFKTMPDIMGLDSLKVTGDVWFGADITLKGKVNITAKPGIKLEIPDGVVIENKDVNDPSDIRQENDLSSENVHDIA
ncbi:Utp--glucose-1-phosphate uridylyltransferase [Thalictrum thalictroides]|uniref:UTP--glucose-1-phosphate uridylyltransferase n=1 Tax=Thalictrum thalictroides TaxID=46969 RepID=A0A7J6WV14_THATH|nr:Utp--glucose-1-phosphate uridylyltransferase [Thalictrum thalictroides]